MTVRHYCSHGIGFAALSGWCVRRQDVGLFRFEIDGGDEEVGIIYERVGSDYDSIEASLFQPIANQEGLRCQVVREGAFQAGVNGGQERMVEWVDTRLHELLERHWVLALTVASARRILVNITSPKPFDETPWREMLATLHATGCPDEPVVEPEDEATVAASWLQAPSVRVHAPKGGDVVGGFGGLVPLVVRDRHGNQAIVLDVSNHMQYDRRMLLRELMPETEPAEAVREGSVTFASNQGWERIVTTGPGGRSETQWGLVLQIGETLCYVLISSRERIPFSEWHACFKTWRCI